MNKMNGVQIFVEIYECEKCHSLTSIENGKEIKCCSICGEKWSEENMHHAGLGTIKDIIENG